MMEGLILASWDGWEMLWECGGHPAKIGMGRLQHSDGLPNAWGCEKGELEGGDEAWAGRDAHMSCII